MTERSGWALIPVGAWIVAGIMFLLPAILIPRYFGLTPESLFGLFLGLMFAGYALVAGYIYGDAPRRGMPRIPWTLLAVLAPNAIGFILYFIVRKPVQRPCAQCGAGISSDSGFCPRCGAAQAA
jgi:hypothetical protein